MQLIDLAMALGMLDFPHPLLADDINFHRVGGGTGLINEDSSGPEKHDHRNAERNDRPDDFEGEIVRGFRGRRFGPAAILQREINDEHENQERKKSTDNEHEEIETIDLIGHVR